MCKFEAIPSVDIRVIAHFLLIFLHEHDPKIDLILVIIVNTLKIFTDFKGFVKNDVAKLVFAVFHAWVVRIPIVLWCKAVMVFACEDAFWCCFTILQHKQLDTKWSMSFVAFHLLDCHAISLLTDLSS